MLNRNAIYELIDTIINGTANNSMAIIMIDIDNFKTINDSMGHHVGDALLQEFSKRFLQCLDQYDTLGRMGGDEFIIILEDLTKLGHENIVIEKLIRGLQEPVYIGEEKLHLSASIGVVKYPNYFKDKDTSAYALITKAELAMYKAKEMGKNRVVHYSDQLSDTVSSKLMVEQKLREALKNNELEMYLQPKVDLSNQNIIGAELLIRWIHNGNFIMPDQFIPIAEETNLIIEIDRWVVSEAVRIIKKLHNDGYELTLALNLSGRTFSNEKIMDEILNTLDLSGKAKYLEIEVTEGVFVSSMQVAIKLIKNIQALGVAVSLDDFGTGYSSFSYLSQIPFDLIKIDRSFVSNLDKTKQRVLTEAIIRFSHDLDIKIIAEGVETHEQLAWLQSQHCEYGQGYYFSKPISYEEFFNLLLFSTHKD